MEKLYTLKILVRKELKISQQSKKMIYSEYIQ